MATLAGKILPAEASSCSSLPPDTYDRYVLGLLEEQERSQIDSHIRNQCPLCLAGVQRSMNLWLVFADGFDQTELVLDFRARLARIAELSNHVLAVPKRRKRVSEPAILISSLVMIGLILVTLLVFTWLAGRESAKMDGERAKNQLSQMANEYAQSQSVLRKLADQNRSMERKLTPTGISEVKQQKKLEENLSKALAEVAQYKDVLNRNEQQTVENTSLVEALSHPGARLLTFKKLGKELDTSVTAYAFVVGDSKVIFVASNLPVLAEGHQYELWIAGKQEEQRFTSAGIFSASPDKPTVVTFDQDKDVVEGMSGLFITEENDVNNSAAPLGAKIMETAGASPSAAVNPE